MAAKGSPSSSCQSRSARRGVVSVCKGWRGCPRLLFSTSFALEPYHGGSAMAGSPKVFISYASEDQDQFGLGERARLAFSRGRLRRVARSVGRPAGRRAAAFQRAEPSRRLLPVSSFVARPTNRARPSPRKRRLRGEQCPSGDPGGPRGGQHHRDSQKRHLAGGRALGRRRRAFTSTSPRVSMRESAYRNLVDMLHARGWVTKPIGRAEVSFEGPGGVLAPPVANFSGRDAELEMLAALLTAGDPNVAVAVSGVGRRRQNRARPPVAFHPRHRRFSRRRLLARWSQPRQGISCASRDVSVGAARPNPTPQQAVALLRKELQRLSALSRRR